MSQDQTSVIPKVVAQNKTLISRDIPVNTGAEQALLGAILSNNLALEKVEDFLESYHFSSKINSIIYLSLKKLIVNNQVADINTLKVFLENEEEFKSNGGIEYLLKISENSISIINAKQYGELIYDLFLRRQLIDIGTDLVNRSFSDFHEGDSNSIVEKTEFDLFNLLNDGETEKGPKKFDDIMITTLDYAEKAFKKNPDVAVLKSGLNDFDKKVGGLHKSDLIIIAGRPSMGKTAFATNIALNICQNDKVKSDESINNILFFSLEMSSEQLATRLLSEVSRIPSEKIRTGNLSKFDFENMMKGSEKIKDLNLFIDDSPALTLSSIRSRARRLKRRKGLDLIIIDYLQLINSESKNYNDNRVKEISDITRGLKALAKEFNIPVIALSQLSRKVEDREEKRPQLADLRESGSIEQDADLVVFLYREEYYLARMEPQEGTEKHAIWTSKMEKIHNVAEAIVAKNRHGPISRIKLHFNASNTKFSDLAESAIE